MTHFLEIQIYLYRGLHYTGPTYIHHTIRKTYVVTHDADADVDDVSSETYRVVDMSITSERLNHVTDYSGTVYVANESLFEWLWDYEYHPPPIGAVTWPTGPDAPFAGFVGVPAMGSIAARRRRRRENRLAEAGPVRRETVSVAATAVVLRKKVRDCLLCFVTGIVAYCVVRVLSDTTLIDN